MVVPHRLASALLAAALAALAAGCGGGSSSAEPLPSGEVWVPGDLKLADLDGDGRLDVVAASMRGSTVAQQRGELVVRLQTAPGVLAAPQVLPVGVFPWKIVVADIDGDGAPDLVVADAGRTDDSGGQGLWLLRQDATPGRFLAAERLLATAVAPNAIAVGDLDGDSAPDIVFSTAAGASLLRQDTVDRGSYLAPVPLPLPGAATALALGDLDGDGRNDLVARTVQSVTAGNASTVLGVMKGQAGGTLAGLLQLPSAAAGLNSTLLELADANGDGRADLLEFLRPCCTGIEPELRTLLQLVDGSFTRVNTSLAGLQGTDGGVFARLDTDAGTDFAAAGFFPTGPSQVQSRANVLLQNGAGAFAGSQAIALPLSGSRIAAGELTGDGRVDLLVLATEHRLLLLPQSALASGSFLAARQLE